MEVVGESDLGLSRSDPEGGLARPCVGSRRRGAVSDYVCLGVWPAFDLSGVALTVGALCVAAHFAIALRSARSCGCGPVPSPPGGCALGVLGWYGAGRFFLEPLHERPEVVFGRVRVDQVVAALLALGAAAALAIRAWRP